MRWLMSLSFAFLAMVCLASLPALAEATEPNGETAPAAGGKLGRPPGRPPLTPEMKAKHLAEFDADGDGKLSDEEKATMKETLAKRRAEKVKPEGGRKRPTKEELLAEFDENGDGKLTGAELEKVRAAHKARNEAGRKGKNDTGTLNDQEKAAAQQAAGGGRGQAGGGPGGLNNELKARMIREFDANGDGKLQGAEMERARAAAARMQAQQRQGGGQGGFQGRPGGGRLGAPGGGGPGGGGGARGGSPKR